MIEKTLGMLAGRSADFADIRAKMYHAGRKIHESHAGRFS